MRQIIIKNVEYKATDESLRDHFKDAGSVVRVTIIKDERGKPKGYAYMEFSTVEGAIRSKLKNETLFLGRQITIMAKRKNLPRPYKKKMVAP